MTKMTGEYVMSMLIEKGADAGDAKTAARITDQCWAMSLSELFGAMQGTSDSVAKVIAEQVLKQRCFEILDAAK